MNIRWGNCPVEITKTVCQVKEGIADIIGKELVGVYLHGSLAMGGFNPARSDIDLIVATNEKLDAEIKRELVRFLLQHSTKPFPIEVSSLTLSQLNKWKHPSLYDFHYSEFWRETYTEELKAGTAIYLNDDEKSDADLAAHIQVINHRGICLAGQPVQAVFPNVSHSDYLASILVDFSECLENIHQDPVYCVLNSIRVYWYVLKGSVQSKQEAGTWGQSALPAEFRPLIRAVAEAYAIGSKQAIFPDDDLDKLKNYLEKQVQAALKSSL